jgi:hypothetical protein
MLPIAIYFINIRLYHLMVRAGGAHQLLGSGPASTVGPHGGMAGMRAPTSSQA